jgi:SEC-C motif
MTEPKRNDLCPCGSGRKYKKCCLAANDDLDLQYRRWQHVESGLIPRLTKFAFDTFGAEVITEAWKVFIEDDSEEEFDPSDPMNMVFMPWCLFTWAFEIKPKGSVRFIKTTIAEEFLKRTTVPFSHDEQLLLRSYIRRPYTLCEIVDVRPGSGVTHFDLLRRVKDDVMERTASQTLRRGDIIYCATTKLDGIRSYVGLSPYTLRPTSKRDILELQKWIVEQIEDDEITEDDLEAYAADIRALYFDKLESMFAPPSLATTDGDPWVPHKIYFDITSADKAFHQLKELAGMNESDLLSEATVVDGRVTKVEIPWLGGTEEARTRLGGPVLLGLVKIDGDHVIVEVNSTERAKLIKELIGERLGSDATYRTTLIEPIESAVEKMWQAAAGAGSSRSTSAGSSGGAAVKFTTTFDATENVDCNKNEMSGEWNDEAGDANDAELRTAMQKIVKRHWETWFDLPVPALNDMTPREAATTEEGRDLLESLLLHYENNASSIEKDLRPDIRKLRRELGLK